MEEKVLFADHLFVLARLRCPTFAFRLQPEVLCGPWRPKDEFMTYADAARLNRFQLRNAGVTEVGYFRGPRSML
jgi:predicted alpha/beta hydrolase